MSDRPRRQPQKLTARRVLFQWRFPVIIVLILIVLCCIPVGVVVRLLSKPEEPEPPHSDEMYQQAVYDTLLAEPHELPSGMNPPKALVTLAPDSTGVEHDGNGRVATPALIKRARTLRSVTATLRRIPSRSCPRGTVKKRTTTSSGRTTPTCGSSSCSACPR